LLLFFWASKRKVIMNLIWVVIDDSAGNRRKSMIS
jgi:hypothetical protein